MQGVGPGSVLGHRYALARRTAQGASYELWLAHDQTLERPVTVVVIDAAHPGADAALDAGRRAAGIEDARLVRIFDVGRDDGLAYLVQEALTGLTTLTALLGHGGLPSDEARRLVGEAAAALEVASARGLHHLRLTPAVVGRTRDGSVKVTGLAVLAALTGDDALPPADASRADAVGLAALTYAALTGRWPLVSPAEGLEAAPRLGSRVAAPSEIAAGVPSDLDSLCRATLIDGRGPATPGEVAERLAPWRSAGGWQSADSDAEERRGRASTSSRAASDAGAVAASAATSTGPGSSNGAAAGSVSTGSVSSGSASNGSPSSVSVSTGSARSTPSVSGALAPETIASGLRSAARRTAGATSVLATRLRDRRPESPDSREPASRAEAPEAAPPHDPAAEPGRRGAVSAGRVSALAQTVAQHAGEAGSGIAARAARTAEATRSARADRVERARRAEQEDEAAQVSLPEVLLAPSEEPEEPVVPLIGSTQVGQPSKTQARAVVGGLLLFVLLAVVLGFRTLVHEIPGRAASSTSARSPASSPTASSASTSSSSDSPNPSSSASASHAVITVRKATGFDPDGDGREMNSYARRAIDGDPDTAWTSEGYSSAKFGGLHKGGVGLVLDLGKKRTVHEAALSLPHGPTDVQLYASDSDSSIDNATEIGSATGVDGDTTITSTDAPSSRYVVVWFTKLVSTGGKYRAALAEITLR